MNDPTKSSRTAYTAAEMATVVSLCAIAEAPAATAKRFIEHATPQDDVLKQLLASSIAANKILAR